MSQTTTPHKYGQLIIGDSSLEKALAAPSKLAVELPLFVPAKQPNKCTKPCATDGNSKKSGGTVGGFMAVPIIGARFGDDSRNVKSKQDVINYCESVCASQILLIIDTGSEAYFVQDDTGCGGSSPVPQFLKFCGIDNMKVSVPLSGMSLTVGTMDEDDDTNFVIEHPLEWFLQPPSTIPAGAQTVSAPTERSQTIIVGNFFLQSLAVTWNASRQTIAFSNLDRKGHRCSAHMYAKPSASEEQKSVGSFEAKSITSGKKSQGARWNKNISLSGEELTFAGGRGQDPILDTAIDLRFMRTLPNSKPNSNGDTMLSVETTNPKDISEICLDAHVTLQDGTRTQVCQPVDTGSGVNLIAEPSIKQTQSVSSPCIGGGSVGSVFKSIAGQMADVRHCDNVSQAQCQTGCCKTCCTPPGTTDTTPIKCSVTFCTGMMSYDPTYTTLSFPLENGTSNLNNVKTYVGAAKNRCLAVPMTGVWGFWFWTQTLNDGDSTTQVSTGLPYYLMSHLGISDPKHANFTLKIWRSDLNTAKDYIVRVGTEVMEPSERDAMSNKMPTWYETLTHSDEPSAAPTSTQSFSPVAAPFVGPVDPPFGPAVTAPFGKRAAAPVHAPHPPPAVAAPVHAPHSPPAVAPYFLPPVAAPKSSHKCAAPVGAPVRTHSSTNGNNINVHISNTNSNSNSNSLPIIEGKNIPPPYTPYTQGRHARGLRAPSTSDTQSIQSLLNGLKISLESDSPQSFKLWPWGVVGLVMFAVLAILIVFVAVRQHSLSRANVSSSSPAASQAAYPASSSTRKLNTTANYSDTILQ